MGSNSKTSSQHSRPVRDDSWDATILHVDMDAFFLSVELLDNPQYRGVPAVVANPHARSVVTSPSYEARAYGVRSAMPLAHAQARCPGVVVLPPHREKYTHYSRILMDIFRSVTPLVEQLSIDEAFLDVAGARRRLGSPRKIATEIKKRVADATGLPCTVGVAGNKSVAKILSTRSKPDGLGVVPVAKTNEFLEPLPVEVIWGVGPKVSQRLHNEEISTVGQLARQDPIYMKRRYGQIGPEIIRLARGIDARAVLTEREAKSVGVEKTFMEDITNRQQLEKQLLELAYECARRTRADELVAQGISVKVRDDKRIIRTKSVAVSVQTASGQAFFQTARRALRQLMQERWHPVRLLGVRADRVIEHGEDFEVQDALFDQLHCSGTPGTQRLEMADAVLDDVRQKFPGASVLPATLLNNHLGGDDPETE